MRACRVAPPFTRARNPPPTRSYLEKDQLHGPSSVNRYISDLSKGCRCVELDLWDGPHGEPLVYHGHTLVGRLRLRDVLEAIREYAFVASEFPVILSLENHCSLRQQGRTAALFREIFGELLAEAPELRADGRLPSPRELARKILIKHKRVKSRKGAGEAAAGPSDNGDNEGEDSDESDSDDDEERGGDAAQNGDGKGGEGGDDDDQDGTAEQEALAFGATASAMLLVMVARNHEDAMRARFKRWRANTRVDRAALLLHSGESRWRGAPEDHAAAATRIQAAARRWISERHGLSPTRGFTEFVWYHADEGKSGVHPALRGLVALAPIKWRGFDASADAWARAPDGAIMSTFREKRMKRLVKRDAAAWAAYGARQLSRVYPAPFRIDSSNFDPLPCWAVGVQMVALNYQTPGLAMRLNDAVFADNGGCGFVLKPACLRAESVDAGPIVLSRRHAPRPSHHHHISVARARRRARQRERLARRVAEGRAAVAAGDFASATLRELADAQDALDGAKQELANGVLRVRVISAQQLPRAFSEPVVTVRLHGASDDPGGRAQQGTTSPGRCNFNPVWCEAVKFSIQRPELALLEFEVTLPPKQGRNSSRDAASETGSKAPESPASATNATAASPSPRERRPGSFVDGLMEVSNKVQAASEMVASTAVDGLMEVSNKVQAASEMVASTAANLAQKAASKVALHAEKELVAQAIVPLKVLRPGFRVVPLADKHGNRDGDLKHASLMCFFSWDFYDHDE